MKTRSGDGNMRLLRMRKPFAEDDLRKLMAVADGEWSGMILFGFYMGLRLGDVAMLNHGQIERKSKFLWVSTGNRYLQSCPIPPPLWRYIEKLPTPQNQEQPLFPTAFALACSGRVVRIRWQFKQLICKAGLCDWSEKPAAEGPAEDDYLPLSFSSLRYTRLVRLRQAAVPEEIMQRLCGHRSVPVVAHCGSLDLHSVVETLPDVYNENPD